MLLIFCCACNGDTLSATSTPPTQAERTLIPRQTFPPASPTPMPTYSTYCENENKVGTYLQFVEDFLSKENSTTAYNVSINDTFKSNKYYYAFTTLTQKDTSKIITDKIYQFLIEGDGLKLVASKTVTTVGNEYTYEFIYAHLNGETVFFSRCGAIYAYKNNGETIYESESSSDKNSSNYEKVRTRPTKFVFEFSDGKALTQEVINNKIMFCISGDVTIKNLTVFSGTRQLAKANIINYQVPQLYHVFKAENQQTY